MFMLSARKVISFVVLFSLLLQSCGSISLNVHQPILAISSENSSPRAEPSSYQPPVFERPKPRIAQRPSDTQATSTNGNLQTSESSGSDSITELISGSYDRGAGNGMSTAGGSTLSADGRYVVFASTSSNIVLGDTNGKADVFVYDRQTGTATRVSVSSSGVQANDDSCAGFAGSVSLNWHCASISADGRYVVFSSKANNLVTMFSYAGISQVYVHDMQTGATKIVSATSNYAGEGHSYGPVISANGRYVAFESQSTYLAGGVLNNTQILVRDLQTSTLTVASLNLSGGFSPCCLVYNNNASISADGRYVAFDSNAKDLVAGDTNGDPASWLNDVFVRDMQTNTTIRVSVSTSGEQANGDSTLSLNESAGQNLSADGRYVVFSSNAANLAPGDTGGTNDVDVFIHDIQTGITTLVPSPDSVSLSPSISGDGSTASFFSGPSLTSLPMYGLYKYDIQTGTTTSVETALDGYSAPALSSDGNIIAYSTRPNSSSQYNVFVRGKPISIISNPTTYSTVGMDGDFSCIPACSQGYEGGPINTRTGAYDYSTTDISIETDAGTLAFERTYSSLTTGLYSTKLGYGWTHNHDLYLAIGAYTNGKRSLTLKGHTANQYTFTQQSGFLETIPELGVYATLVQNASSFVLTDKSQGRYEFNLTTGRLISYTNLTGRKILYTYDSSGRLTKIAEQSGQRYLTLAYSRKGTNIISVTDHTGRKVLYGYDGNNDLTSVTDPLTKVWRYTYSNHRLWQVLDPANAIVERTEYDANGRAWQQYNGEGKLIVELTYDAHGTTTVVDALGNSETQTYSGRGTLEENTNFYAANQQKAYNTNFRPAISTDALENPTYLTWSSNGADLTKIVDALQNRIDITYGALNNPVSILDPARYETKYFYNDQNFPSLPTRIEYPLSFDDGATYVGTDYEYYPPSSGAYAGKVKFVTDALGNQTYYTYTAIGQIASVTTANGTANAIATTYTYDNLGRLTDETAQGITTHNVYDLAGRLTKTTQNYNTSYSQNYQNLYNIVTEFRYDSRGNLIAVIDTYGVITRTYYDLAGRPVAVVQNLVGQNIETASPPARGSGAVDENIRTDTVYADNGNVIAMIDPDNVITRTYYDLANRPVTVVQNFIGDLAATIPPAFDPAYPDQNIRTDTIYDANSNVIAVIDTDGVITRTYYDPLNRPAVVVQNLVINGVPEDIYAPLESVPSYNAAYPDRNLLTDTIYDTNGNVIATIDAANTITRTYYDAMNRPETIVENFVGDIYSSTPPERDPDALTAVAIVNLRSDTWYDKAGNVIATIDPRGVVTRTYYDTANRPVTFVQNLVGDYPNNPPARGTGGPDQNVRTDTVYDQYGRTSSTIDPVGRETRYEYDLLGQLKKVTVNYVAGQDKNYQDKFNIVTEYSYDALGRKVTSTDTLGRINRNTYDNLSRVVANTVNYRSDQGQNYKDASGNRYNIITSYTYDIQGNQIATTDTADVVTRTYFDRLSRPITVVRNLNQSITNPAPPARGNPLDPANIRMDTLYRGNGTVDQVVDEMGKITNFEYDDLGRQILIQDPSGNSATSHYNSRGEVVLATDANFISTKFAYDRLGRLTAVVENSTPDGTPVNHETNVRTEYAYDANGNRLTILDGKGHLTIFTYDALNRLKTERDAMSHPTTYGYDVMGNRVSLLDANQKNTAFQYDELNRLYKIDYPDPDPDVTFGYDVVGRRTSMTDGLGSTGWIYDNLDRPTSITDPFGTTVSYDYSTAGNRSLISYPGITVNYLYDSLNRLTHVTGGMGGTVGYGYDSVGRLKSITRPNGINSTYQYYDNGWLQSLTHASTTTTFASYQYEYYPTGNRKKAIENILWPGGAFPTATPSLTSTVTETATSVDTDTPTPTLTETPLPTDTPSETPTVTDTVSPTLTPTDTATPTDTPITGGFKQGGALFLIRFPLAPKTPTPSLTPTWTPTFTFTPTQTNTVTSTSTETFTPSPTSSTPPTPTIPPVQTSMTIDYVYDPLNRLTEANYSNLDYYHYFYDAVGNRSRQEKMIIGLLTTDNYIYDAANRLESINGVIYTWDANGNLLNDGVNTYTYNSANRLIAVSGQQATLSYRYNGLNDRLQEIVNDQTTTFTMDLNTDLTQALSDGTYNYIYGNGRIAQVNTGTEYFLGDALGSVRQLTNSSGAVTDASAYDPYGVTTQTYGDSQTTYGYTNEYASQGLVYLRARHYVPETGRFIEGDIWEGDPKSPLSFNKWGYVNGNPINHTDPSGLCVFCKPYDRVRIDTRGYSTGNATVSAKAASGLYAKPNPNSGIMYNLTDNQYVTILAGELQIEDMNWGWRHVMVTSQAGPTITGWVRNRSLLDNCNGTGAFNCMPIKSFTAAYGFGPNLFAQSLCAKNTSCAWYSSLRGLHNGLDFSALDSSPLIWPGAKEGKLMPYSGDAEPAFQVVYGGMTIVYGHSRSKVPYGETVRPGQFIGTTDNQNGHLHFGIRNQSKGHRSVFYNPLYFFSRSLQKDIVDKMHGQGGYDPKYTAYSMASFDNKYAGDKTNYWFWGESCLRWSGIVMEDSFWDSSSMVDDE